MDTPDEHDELPDDDDGDDVPAYRERAAAKLDQIVRDVKDALAEHDIDVFFTVPSSGHSILTFGTIADPDDEAWKTVSEIVSAVVRRTIGVERTRCRSLLCATTRDQAQQNALA
jgi:hypothetical protein